MCGINLHHTQFILMSARNIRCYAKGLLKRKKESGFCLPFNMRDGIAICIGKWKSFSMNFTLATGNYISIGKQFYHAAPMPESSQTDADNMQYREYIERPNNFRMPAYHHLDISYVLDNRKGKGSSWVFGIYNLYARKNPSIIYHKQTREGVTTRSWSLLPFVPSVTWSYHF